MHLTTQRGEELSSRNVPVPIQPRPLLPARQSFQHYGVFRIVEPIIRHSRRHKDRITLRQILPLPRGEGGIAVPSGQGESSLLLKYGTSNLALYHSCPIPPGLVVE